MTKQIIIERLQKKDWQIKVTNEHELALVLNACLDAHIFWREGETATRFIPGQQPKGICFHAYTVGISYYVYECMEKGHRDITNWFFEEIIK